MIYPTVEELGKKKHNRYAVTIATAKAARMVTEEYVEQRENAEKLISKKETDKSISALISKDIRDEKAIITAIKRLQNGEYIICDPPIDD